MPIDPSALPHQILVQSKTILQNYTNDFFSFIHNNRHRHHIDEINRLICAIDQGTITSTATLLKQLHTIKPINPKGSLAKTIQAIHDLQIESLQQAAWFSPENVLSYALSAVPETIPALLNELSTMPMAARYNLLSQLDHHNMNILMRSICYQTGLTPWIIKTIQELSPDLQKSLFRQCTLQGSNMLMLAAVSHAGILTVLINALVKLNDKKLICDLLDQYSADKNTALILAIENQPAAVPHLFDLIKTLPLHRQSEILNQRNYMGLNSYQLSILYQSKTPIPQLILCATDATMEPLPLLVPSCSQPRYMFPSAANKVSREIIDSTEEISRMLCSLLP